MELITLHGATAQAHPHIRTQCCQILNAQWRRSSTLRLRSLDASRDALPTCLALVQCFEPGPELHVLGHARLATIPADPRAVWLESIVIHPQLRRRGLGRYLMLAVEDFCRQRGFCTAYLSTVDQQAFYGHLGYAVCPPVVSYNGQRALPPLKPKSPPRPSTTSTGTTMELDATPVVRVGGGTGPPPPPPPPPPSSGGLDTQDAPPNGNTQTVMPLPSEKLRWPVEPPRLTSPPGALNDENISCNKPPDACRATLRKDFMTKVLS